jgi:hypothetical protein
MSPAVSQWKGKLQQCITHKKPFQKVADQCMGFFSGAMGFMYDEKFKREFLGTVPAPQFKITICKAFELVALFGPTLYWRNPIRIVNPRDTEIQLQPQHFGQGPEAQQLFQMAQQMTQQQKMDHSMISMLLSAYLNYTPTEQPNGLAWHAEQAITESLVKGRGCLWPMPYAAPGSDRVLTGCFYDSVDNLFIDPDATTINDARYIIKKETKPLWEIEREFALPRGTMRGKGTHTSASGQGGTEGRDSQWDSQISGKPGVSYDMGTIYKIWSKGGVGGRLSGMAVEPDPITEAFDKVVGDYAYCVVSDKCNYFLNAPTELIKSASDAEIAERFAWPIPYWKDGLWPVVLFDYYNKPNDPWAIAPLAPGLGELTYINILMSALASHVHTASRTFVAMRKSLGDINEQLIRSGQDLSIIKLDDHDLDLDKQVKFLEYPTLNTDTWQIIDRLMYQFDRRTGLTELMAGLSQGGKVQRVAEDVKQRADQTKIRPEHMAGKVEDALSVCASMEKMCARWFVQAKDLSGLFNPVEQYLWQKHVTSADTDVITRQLQATVLANSARRPDKRRDAENLQQLMQYFAPLDQMYAQMTGDFGPMNGAKILWGKASDQDVSGMLYQPPQPEQKEEDPAAEQEAQKRQQDMQQAAQQHQQRMQQSTEQHGQRMQQASQSHQQRSMEQVGQMLQGKRRFSQDFDQDEEKHDQDIRQAQESHRTKITLAKKAAAAKPSSNGSSNGKAKK